MARTYRRDSRGRFAGGGGGSGGGGRSTSKPRTLPKTTTAKGRARTAETRARSALKAGGGTKAARSLATAQRARDWYKATGSGTKRSATRPRSGIRRTGGLPRPVAGNAVRPTARQGQRPLGLKGNSIRPLKRGAKDLRTRLGDVRTAANAGKTRLARQSARDIAGRLRKGIDGELSSIALQNQGGRLNRAGADVIRRRAARASAAAAKGSKPAARAREIYGQQLAFTGKGKVSRKAKNNLRPGPRNTKGVPPKRRKRKN